MSASAETSKGAIFFSLIFAGVLFGVCISQTWLYFQWWPRDGWVNQAPVTILLLLESLQIACLFVSTYEKDLGHKDQLILPDTVQLMCNYLSAFVVQIYFCVRICRLVEGHRGVTGNNIWYLGPFVAMILAFLQLSTGFSQAIISYRSDSYAMLKSARIVTILQAAASFVCDVIICTYLTLFLHHMRRDTKKIRAALRTLIIHTINRGMATVIFSAATLVLFVAFPETYLFLIALAPSGKVYTVTLLSNLNMRLHIQSEMYPKSVELNPAQVSIAVPDTPNSPTSPPNSAQSDDLAPRKATMGYTSCETIV